MCDCLRYSHICSSTTLREKIWGLWFGFQAPREHFGWKWFISACNHLSSTQIRFQFKSPFFLFHKLWTMKNNSFSLKSTADPFFFCRLHKISSKYWSRNRANTGEKHGFLVTLLKFSTICSRYKMFPPWHVKITPVCGIKLAGFFFNTFPWQSENFDRKDNKKNSKVIKLDNLWIKRDDGNVTTRKLAFPHISWLLFIDPGISVETVFIYIILYFILLYRKLSAGFGFGLLCFQS